MKLNLKVILNRSELNYIEAPNIVCPVVAHIHVLLLLLLCQLQNARVHQASLAFKGGAQNSPCRT